ncbi:MAG: PAS domain S-box protein, partial [Bacteroidota bacterium]
MNKIKQQETNNESLALFRALIDQSNDAIEVIDPVSGSLIDSNMKAWQELGYNHDEFLKLTVFDIDPTISLSIFQRVMDDVKKNKIRIFESIHKRKDGSEFPVEINLKYIQ